MPSSTSHSATLIGFCAILLWSLLAVLTTASGNIPAFQLTAITFGFGGLIGAATWLFRRHAAQALKQSVAVWALGIAGFFGYHVLYFSALRLAPPVDAQLINYLWPLLVVLFSALPPHSRLRWHHVVGVCVGLAGTILLFIDRGVTMASGYLPGYAAALVAAFVWATYSVVMSRKINISTDVVVGFFIATSGLAIICHFILEETVWPSTLNQWIALAGLGIGPVGMAYYLWDFGTKHGDIRVLGAASYAAPVLSTAFLVLAGFARPSVTLLLSAILIASGGIIAAKDLFRKVANQKFRNGFRGGA
jgi:drug/metabolite transporter (DMT)-like permease